MHVYNYYYVYNKMKVPSQIILGLHNGFSDFGHIQNDSSSWLVASASPTEKGGALI